MSFLRSLCFNLAMFGSGLFLSFVGLLFRPVAPRYLGKIAKIWASFCLVMLRILCGVRVQIRGMEALPAGPAMIAAQHQSALDILVWIAVLPNLALVFKRELSRIPVFGSLLVPAGMIQVDRDGAARALRKMVAECHAAIAAGRQIVIFPEGTRVAPDARVRLQSGIAALAKAVPAPLFPAATDSGRCWPSGSFRKSPGKVHVKLYSQLDSRLDKSDIIETITRIFYVDGAV